MGSADHPDLKLLVVSGSTRSASTNTAFCRTVGDCAPPGVVVTVFEGCASLPHFNPDDDREPLPHTVAALRSEIADADAVLFCTPEYAGTLPGSFKNLLDWTVGGTELNGKPVAWIKVAVDAGRGEGAHSTLANVLGYVEARILHNANGHVPISQVMVGSDGLVADPVTRRAITETVLAVLESLDRSHAWPE
jgi:NAD(P)H-dependent FMN reductase